MTDSNRFESLVRAASPGTWKNSIIQACDAAFLVKVWFSSYDLDPTAADIVAMVGIILRHERELKRREEEGV